MGRDFCEDIGGQFLLRRRNEIMRSRPSTTYIDRPSNRDDVTGTGFIARKIFFACLARLFAAGGASPAAVLPPGKMRWRMKRARSRMS